MRRMVVIIGIHGQHGFNVFCGVCDVLISVDDCLLTHLLPGIQFMQNLPSTWQVQFEWGFREQIPKRVHSQHQGPDSIFCQRRGWIWVAILSSLLSEVVDWSEGGGEWEKWGEHLFFWWPNSTIGTYVGGIINFFYDQEKDEVRSQEQKAKM